MQAFMGIQPVESLTQQGPKLRDSTANLNLKPPESTYNQPIINPDPGPNTCKPEHDTKADPVYKCLTLTRTLIPAGVQSCSHCSEHAR